MKIKDKKLFSIFVLILLFIGLKINSSFHVSKSLQNIENNNLNNIKFKAKCTRVIDGDTIEILFLENRPINCQDKEKVRLIGVNTPELNLHKKEDKEYFASEAADFTKNELENQYVELQFDNVSDQKDRYGRLLCYVFVDGHNFNQILIEQGYGRYYSKFDFEPKYMALFEKAEYYSKSNKLGLWKNEYNN